MKRLYGMNEDGMDYGTVGNNFFCMFHSIFQSILSVQPNATNIMLYKYCCQICTNRNLEINSETLLLLGIQNVSCVPIVAHILHNVMSLSILFGLHHFLVI